MNTNVFLFEEANSTRKIMAGLVKDVSFYLHNGVGRALTVIEDYTGQEWKVFWSNKPESPKAPQMRDRIQNAKVRPGVFIGVMGYFNTDKKTANGLNFQYSGDFLIQQEGKKDIHVLIGRIMRPTWRPATPTFTNDQFEVSMPVDGKDGNTEWYKLQFINSDRIKTGDIAKAIYQQEIAPETFGALDENGKPKLFPIQAAVKCGEIITRTGKDGKIYKNLKAFKLVVNHIKNSSIKPPEHLNAEQPAKTQEMSSADPDDANLPFANPDGSTGPLPAPTENTIMPDPEAYEDGFMDVPDDEDEEW